MIKYKIGAIFEKDAKTPKQSHQYRVGREGVIQHLEKGLSMIFDYQNGNYLLTSPVKEIDETDYGVWVYTRNSVYRFDRM